MKLLDLYKSILGVARLTVDEDGYVSNELMENKQPFLISGKRLVIPTPAQLRNPDRESRIIFHPLRENALQTGESEVLAAFRVSLNTRINAAVALLMANLTSIATSVAEQKKLNPDQMEYLTLLKDVDEEKTFPTLAKIIAAMPLGQTKQVFVSIYLKKGAKLNDRAYKRAGIVSFPLYQELLEEKNEIYGVPVRKKDRLAFKALLEYIFGPEIAIPNHYSFGSSSDVAPSLEAIMGAVKNIGAVINAQVEKFKDVLEDHEEMMIDADWVEAFDNIEKFVPEIRLIPSQLGNEAINTPDTPVVENTTGINGVTGVIPVKEKLTFAALPGAQPTPVAPVNNGLGLVSQGGMLSLSQAMAGMRSIGQPSMMGNGLIGVNPNPFVGNGFGFAALPNAGVNNNPFAGGMGGSFGGGGFNTPRL